MVIDMYLKNTFVCVISVCCVQGFSFLFDLS